MNCNDFEQIVMALARERLPDDGLRERGLMHITACEGCAARLAAERALVARVRDVVAELASQEPPSSVDEIVLAEFRARTAAAESLTAAALTASRNRRAGLLPGSVAAGILLLVSIMAIIWNAGSSTKPNQERQAEVPAPGVRPEEPTPVNPVVVRDQTIRPDNEKKRVARRPSSARVAEAEVVTRFFPLREGADLTELQSMQLVRVELAGSALSELGLTVDPESAAEPVKADVILGQDGLARAIRFVR